MPPSSAPPRPRQRGVSLIEALVALTVMSFGMLAVVGVQATLRQNSDVAKQRSEAVRIGQEAIERWRAFARVEVDPTGVQSAYDDIPVPIDGTPTAELVTGYTTNTQYTLVRRVSAPAGQKHKSVRIEVQWQDRTGGAQSITLDSQIAGSDLSLLAGVVNARRFDSPQVRPRGRHSGIPTEARDMGTGVSAFIPPADGGSPGTRLWVFDNASGLIVRACGVAAGTTTAALSGADIANCPDSAPAQLLSGYVRFATSTTQPTAADAEAPTSMARNLDMLLIIADGRVPECFDDAPTTSTAAATRSFVKYYCAIPANATRSWSGYSTIVPLPFTDVPASNWHIPAKGVPAGTPVDYRLCRYTPATSNDEAVQKLVPNPQHPYIYRIEYADPARQLQPLPMPPLTNQNFLVIRSPNSCPTDVAPDPARGDFINSNTLPHEPLP